MLNSVQLRSSAEEYFYKRIFEATERFMQKSGHSSFCNVLVFLPLNPRGRYLIHRCVESFPELSSVSIGKSINRRVVLYFPKKKLPQGKTTIQENKMTVSHQQNKTSSGCKPKETKENEMSSPPRNERRPDKAIYVPKHRRNTGTNGADESTKSDTTDRKNSKEIITSHLTTCDMDSKDNKLLRTDVLISHSAEEVGQRLSKDIVFSVFETLPGALKLLKPKLPVVNVPLLENNRLLPGMATNFVNLAIENALELLKSIKTCESNATQDNLFKQGDEKHSNSEQISKETKCTEGYKLCYEKEDAKKQIDRENLANNENISVDLEKENEKLPESCKQSTPNKTKKSKKSKNKNDRLLKIDSKNNSNESRPIKYSSKKKTKKNSTLQTEVNKGIESKPVDISIEPHNDVTEEINHGEDLDDWDSNWTEDGECLNKEMSEELSTLTGIQNPVIENAEGIDYLNFTPKLTPIGLDAGEFGHVLEIFDLSPVLKTPDIYNALSSAGIIDINLTWVDDTHALLVFASQAAAHTAMKHYIPVFQMRQVINGTQQSKTKAREFKDSLLPYKKRPTSTGMVARNLVAGALGIRTNVSAEQRRKERDLLKEAREERRQKKKKQTDLWENPQ